MKIALVHNLPKGGAKRNTFEQIKGLAKRGHDFYEFTFSSTDADYLPFGESIVSSKVYQLSWKMLHKVPIPGLSPLVHLITDAINILRLDCISRRMARQIDKEGYDLVYVVDCRYLMVPLILRHLITPSLLYLNTILDRHRETVSNHSSNWLRELIIFTPIKSHKRMIRTLQVKSIRNASCILTNSEFTRRDLKDDVGIDSFVVFPGVDIEVFKPAINWHGTYILTVGSLSDDKGHELVIESTGLVPEAFRLKVVIATLDSDPQKISELIEYARNKGVKLEFKRAANSVEMANIYQGARLVAYAPLKESFGLVALEAMACGVPVVAVDEGGLKETIRNNETGYLVSRDPQLFAEMMQRILGDDSLAVKFGSQGRTLVEKRWDWHSIIDELECHMYVVKNHLKDSPCH